VVEKRDKSKIIVELPDDKGRRSVDIPKEKFDEWVKTGQAKPLTKVLIMGPWGIKEDWWDIAEENRHFIDETDTEYAICAYENGEPQYSFISKKLGPL
jgi:hypothetical protein